MQPSPPGFASDRRRVLPRRLFSGIAAAGLSTVGLIAADGRAAEPPGTPSSVQLLGTVYDIRDRWNPFVADNDMAADGPAGDYVRRVRLSASGGRNGDGIYAIRFGLDHRLDRLCKTDPKAPASHVVCNSGAANGNIVFRAPADGDYAIRFSPKARAYAIEPSVSVMTRVESMQVNGFVFDAEGGVETERDGHVRPAEKWDETRPSHQMRRLADGSFALTLPLSARGGHEHNGVYQFLFSANGNDDWGYCAINGQPGRLAGGCGYSSRLGRISESAVVIRVLRDADYTIVVFPDQYRYAVTPRVESLNALPSFQVNGSLFAEPWRPTAPDHQMRRGADGRWEKTVRLSPDGGEEGNGVYAVSFSIGQEFALDSVAYGGRWGEAWHALPQESNILFRVARAGNYTFTLDPAADRFAISPGVEPIEGVRSLKIAGNFEEFADDGGNGWALRDERHRMTAAGGKRFVRLLRLRAGQAYDYKYAANDAGWGWGFADYPYDGERRLASHGNPPPLRFVPDRSGLYQFEADLATGHYAVTFVRE